MNGISLGPTETDVTGPGGTGSSQRFQVGVACAVLGPSTQMVANASAAKRILGRSSVRNILKSMVSFPLCGSDCGHSNRSRSECGQQSGRQDAHRDLARIRVQ